MPIVQIIHNPTAGDEEHTKKNLIQLIESQGLECRYSSTKKPGWEKFKPDTDMLVLAGGDGTIRKVTAELLSRKLLDKRYPIGLLPLGTANNIARTLKLHGKLEDLSQCWEACRTTPFDVGLIQGLDEQPAFFLESYGTGLFPRLMSEMKLLGEKEDETPTEKIKRALRVLHTLVLDYQPRECTLLIDGVDHSGHYLLVEVMNTTSFGPNLSLAPTADPGDGLFDVVVIGEEQRAEFASYVQDLLNGHPLPFSYHTFRGQKIEIEWQGTHAHMDDELLRKMKKFSKISIEVQKGILEFIIP
ncbi:diacylglycerol/lipid kinase family protein [Arundinibacter roseus]|uniref:Diacylglycerol kinase n=1 Tax=Arundinibacter roseus TaxID=2070510 RepID=A0A4R4K6H1_9BACT|nr:diacylglycerol kinase family protein [Arundinibacter roseus]TDB62262.1 diacylglycerol kinase [Arundinibacter roseus]